MLYRFGKKWPEDRLHEIAALPQNRNAGAAMCALLDKGCKPGTLAPFLHHTTGNTYDGYDILLGQRLARECSADDVPALLAKIATWPAPQSHGGNPKTLEEALIANGISALDRIDVREAVVGFITTRSEAHGGLFDSTRPEQLARFGLDNPEQRRALLSALADALPLTAEPIPPMVHLPLLREDFFWLLAEVAMSQGTRAAILARLAFDAVWQIGSEHAEALDYAYNASSELRALLPQADRGSIFKTVCRLRSEAKEKQQLQMEEFQAQLPRRPRYNQVAHFARALSRCRAGHVEGWVDLCVALTQPKSEHDTSLYFQHTDVRELPGWQMASDELRGELTRFARRFLLEVQVPEPPPTRIPEAFFGLAFALSLFVDEVHGDPELCAAIKPIWILALLRRGDSHDELLAKTLRALVLAAPTIATDGFEMEFQSCWSTNGLLHNSLISLAWSPQVEEAISRVLEGSPLQPTTYESGLTLLAQFNHTLAERIASRRLAEYACQAGSPSRRSAIAACLFTVGNLWREAWPLFVRNLTDAQELVLEHRYWLDLPGSAEKLTEMPTAFVSALYGVMLELFPTRDSPRTAGPRELGPIDKAYDLQSRLQGNLEERGAYTELKLIYEQNDTLRKAWWLGRSLERAKTHAHAQRRHAPTATEFIQFLATEGGTFVRDNATLQNAVMASLRRFEKQLHPLVITALWEDAKPRKEEALQIEATRHLKSEFESKGIVVNMEVKVEGKQGVDILVEAPPYSVTIEVKQAHATDKDRPVLESMGLQLRDSYLTSRHTTHGIYVVGWYFCPAFRPHGRPRLRSIEDARAYFDLQAKELSISGFSLDAAVLDCCWSDSIPARAKRNKRAKPKKIG